MYTLHSALAAQACSLLVEKAWTVQGRERARDLHSSSGLIRLYFIGSNSLES